MVRLNTSFKEITTTFPSIPGSELKVKDGLTTADFEQAMDAQSGDGKGGVQMMLVALEKMIVDWNIEDENGQKLPITRDNLKQVDILDLREVFESTTFAKRVNEMQKKT